VSLRLLRPASDAPTDAAHASGVLLIRFVSWAGSGTDWGGVSRRYVWQGSWTSESRRQVTVSGSGDGDSPGGTTVSLTLENPQVMAPVSTAVAAAVAAVETIARPAASRRRHHGLGVGWG
jgi:hypothetical protein